MGNRLQVIKTRNANETEILRVLVSEWPPFISYNWAVRTRTPHGPMIQILETFRSLTNIGFKLQRPKSVSTFGTESENGTWTGRLGFMQQEKTDIILGPIPMTYKAAKIGEFTTPLTIDHLHILSVETQGTIGLLDPYAKLDWKVWTLFIGIFVTLILLAIIFEHFTRPMHRVSSVRLLELLRHRIHHSTIVLSFIASLFSQDFQATLRSAPARMIVTTNYIMVVIVSALFSNLLTTSLVVQPQGNVIDTLDDLVRKPKVCPYVYQDSPQLRLFQEGEEEVYLKMNRRLSQCKEGVINWNAMQEDGPMQNILRKAYVFIDSSPEILRYGNSLCKKAPETWLHVGNPFSYEILATIMRRTMDPTLKRIFNAHIAYLVESGIFGHWVEQASEHQSECFFKGIGKAVQVDALHLITLQKLFYLYLSVCGTASVVFLLELLLGIFTKCQRKRTVRRIPVWKTHAMYQNYYMHRTLNPLLHRN